MHKHAKVHRSCAICLPFLCLYSSPQIKMHFFLHSRSSIMNAPRSPILSCFFFRVIRRAGQWLFFFPRLMSSEEEEWKQAGNRWMSEDCQLWNLIKFCFVLLLMRLYDDEEWSSNQHDEFNSNNWMVKMTIQCKSVFGSRFDPTDIDKFDWKLFSIFLHSDAHDNEIEYNIT